jgi:ABC-type phosphate/phosphonate transport system substrate-binding protein
MTKANDRKAKLFGEKVAKSPESIAAASVARKRVDASTPWLEVVKAMQTAAKERHAGAERCTSMKTEGFSGSPQVPCNGVIRSDGSTSDTCGEPCSFLMHSKILVALPRL